MPSPSRDPSASTTSSAPTRPRTRISGAPKSDGRSSPPAGPATGPPARTAAGETHALVRRQSRPVARRCGRSGLGTPLHGGAVDGFLLAYDGFDPQAEGLREALTSTGNGYLCVRGAAEWEDADGVHYPGTYAHGGYNRETTILGGLPVLNEDLVNLPNWLGPKLGLAGAGGNRAEA